MERLHNLLVEYNQNIPETSRYSWSKQFLAPQFPMYWQQVYSYLECLDRKLQIVEIGSGQGDVTAIPLYLGFSKVISYERNFQDAAIAIDKIKNLFSREDIVKNVSFPDDNIIKSDILILVNCVYSDGITRKSEYLQRIMAYDDILGHPKHIILEVVDSSYSVPDADFPNAVRLNEEDVISLFPNSIIEVVQTYKYPINKRTKKLYLIERIS